MEITNLNIGSILLIGGILIFILYSFLYLFRNQKIINYYFTYNKKNNLSLLKYIILILSILILIPSILGVKIKNNLNNNLIVNGIDIIFILDVGKSMNVEDIKSNNYTYKRLDFAKKAIGNFVLKNPNNGYSLIIFAGEAISVLPITTDTNFFLSSLENVDYKNLNIQGSNFENAFIEANNRFVFSENSNAKAIIFISDGGDDGDFIDIEKIKNYKDENCQYFIVGVGTKQGGKIIIGKDFTLRPIYQTYNNETIISKLNEKNLSQIANALDGKYILLNKFSDLDKFTSNMENIEKKAINKNKYSQLYDISRYLGFISLFFFLIFLIIYFFENNIYKLIIKND